VSGQRRPPAPSPHPAPAPPPAVARPRPARTPAIAREDLNAAVAAREELGERLEPEVIDAFLDRVESSLDARIDERMSRRGGRSRFVAEDRAKHFTGRIAASLGIGIPLTAIAGGIANVPGVLAVWIAIVVLNIYYTEAEKEQK
jgi:hypothetical protein